MNEPAFIAVDWGTTNRRCYLVSSSGEVLRSVRDDRGVTAIFCSEFEEEAEKIRNELGDLPMLLAGMVGSNIGWKLVPYVAAPAGLEDLAKNLMPIDSRTFIVPGVSALDRDRADVMRGEEVQLLGAVENGSAPANAYLCQPGTHCKWVQMKERRIASFHTAMTGELFAMLRKDSLLSKQLQGEAALGGDFEEGVRAGMARDLATSLFGMRASALLGQRNEASSSYASGVLIGADVAARLENYDGPTVYILADGELAQLYSCAVAIAGGDATIIDSHAAFVSGISSIWRRSHA